MKHALLIAVDRFADARLKPLSHATANAVALGKALVERGYKVTEHTMLLNDMATRRRVETCARQLGEQLTNDDELLCYLAGYGFGQRGETWYVCHDAHGDPLAETSLELRTLYEAVIDAGARRVTFLLDLSLLEQPPAAAWNDVAIEEFFASQPRAVCLAACRANEASHAGASPQLSIWSQHVVEAFRGEAAAALTRAGFLTAASLHKYLSRAVPRTLTKTFASKKEQTPWLSGAGETRLADLREAAAKHRPEADPHATHVKNVTLLVERRRRLRDLSGYKETHTRPTRASTAADAFLSRIASEEITADIHEKFGALKAAFNFKRADLHLSDEGDGAATIITPHFNYSVTVALDRHDTSHAVFRRTVDAIKDVKQVASPAFARVFAALFDTIEFDAPRPVDLPSLIDRIEELDDERLALEYDPRATYCRLRVENIAGEITIAPRTLSIVYSKPQPPQTLLHAFLGLLHTLVDEHGVLNCLPARGPDESGA